MGLARGKNHGIESAKEKNFENRMNKIEV